jgi:hypothetical protein
MMTLKPALVALAAAGVLTAGCAAQTGTGQAAPVQTETSAPGSTTAPAATPTGGTSTAGAPTAGTPTTSGSGGAGSSASASGTRCHTGDLAGSLRPEDAAAGNRYSLLVLTNTSHRTCTLYGYGGIQLADAAGRPVPTRQQRDPAHPPTLVRLAPGARASAALHWTAVPGVGEQVMGPCEPTAAMLLVIPPDERTQLSVPWRYGPVCGHGAIDQWAYAAGIVAR